MPSAQPAAASRHDAAPLTVMHTLRSLAVNGITSVVLRNVKELSQRGVRSIVCSIRDDDHMAHAFRDIGVEPLFIRQRGPSTTLRSIVRLRKVMAELGVHAVHTNQTVDLFLAGTAARRSGIPVVASIHWLAERDTSEVGAGSAVSGRARQWLRLLADRTLADRIIAVSGAVRDTHAALLGSSFPASRVEVLFPGVEMSSVPDAAAIAEERSGTREELGVPKDAIVLLNIGRLHPVKGQLHLIPMMAHLRERLPNARLLIAGEGPLRSALEAAIREHGLDRHVRLLGARLDIPVLLRASDALVLASESEAAPLPLMEAMRESKPVVATGVGGVPEMVENGVTGYVVPRGMPHEMADAVVQMFTPPERAPQMGADGRRVALQRFDVARIAERLEAIYREISPGR